MKWQKKQGLTLVFTGLLMGAAVYGTDVWKSRQLLAKVCVKPIEQSPGTWEEWVSGDSFLRTKSLTGVVLFCSDSGVVPARVLPADIPENLKVVCLYPDSLATRAMEQWITRQRAGWSTEKLQQNKLYEKRARQRLSNAFMNQGDQTMNAVREALLPMDLLTNGQTTACRRELVGLLLGEFARYCLSHEDSQWLIVYDGILYEEMHQKFTRNSRVHYEEWGDE